MTRRPLPQRRTSVTGNMNPTRIRGVLYPSQAAAARALGIKPNTVARALNRGTEEFAGLGRRWPSDFGQKPKPCEIDGVQYPSQKAAATALGLTPSCICMRLRRKREKENG
jgi:hypothetical protein